MCTTTSSPCSVATRLHKSEEDLTLNEQLWFKEPDSESQQARELYGPCSRGTKRFKRITAQRAQEQLPSQVLLPPNDQRRLVRQVSYVDQNENWALFLFNLKEHLRTIVINLLANVLNKHIKRSRNQWLTDISLQQLILCSNIALQGITSLCAPHLLSTVSRRVTPLHSTSPKSRFDGHNSIITCVAPLCASLLQIFSRRWMLSLRLVFDM